MYFKVVGFSNNHWQRGRGNVSGPGLCHLQTGMIYLKYSFRLLAFFFIQLYIFGDAVSLILSVSSILYYFITILLCPSKKKTRYGKILVSFTKCYRNLGDQLPSPASTDSAGLRKGRLFFLFKNPCMRPVTAYRGRK